MVLPSWNQAALNVSDQGSRISGAADRWLAGVVEELAMRIGHSASYIARGWMVRIEAAALAAAMALLTASPAFGSPLLAPHTVPAPKAPNKAVLVGATQAAAQAASLAGDQAVTYQLDAAHDGAQPSDPISPPLTKLWSISLGSAVSYPLIANGRVFVIADNVGWSGSKLYALDPLTGAVAWGPIDLGSGLTAPTDPPEFAHLAYDNGRVFTMASTEVRAFDSVTGAQSWRVQMDPLAALISPPVATNGVVYVTNGNSPNELFALSESDGHIIWQQPVSEGDNSSPAIDANNLYVSYECEDVTAMSLANGTTIWHDTTDCFGSGGPTAVLHSGRLFVRSFWKPPEILDASSGTVVGHFSSAVIPAFDGGLGFYLTGSTLTATDLVSGLPTWSFSGDGQLDSNPIVANGFVYEGSRSGEMYVLDERTGVVAWSGNLGAGVAATGEGKWQMFSAPAIGQGLLVVPLSGGGLVGLRGPNSTIAPIAHQGPYSPTFDAGGTASDAVAFRVGIDRQGHQAGSLPLPLQRNWSVDLGGTVYYPLIAAGRIFVTAASPSNADSLLYAIDSRTGTILWGPLDLGGGARTSAIAYDGGRVFALGPSGIVQAYSAANGAQVWASPLRDTRNWLFEMAPVATGGALFVSGAGAGGSEFALNEADGTLLWRSQLWSGDANPGVTARGVLYNDGCNQFYDTASGSPIWTRYGGCTGGGNFPVPSYHSTRFYVGNRILNEADGQVSGAYSSGPPGAYDGSLGFYLVGSTIQAEDLVTQRIVWTFVGDGALVTAPLSVNGVLFVGSSTGTLYGLNESNGAILWSDSAGTSLSGISYEWPLSDMNAGDNSLLVPAGTRLVAFAGGGPTPAPTPTPTPMPTPTPSPTSTPPSPTPTPTPTPTATPTPTPTPTPAPTPSQASFQYYFTWFDRASSPGFKGDNIHVVDPGPSDANVTVRIPGCGDQSRTVSNSGGEQIFSCPGGFGGPVTVSSNQPVLASQRVQYYQSFNEVWQGSLP